MQNHKNAIQIPQQSFFALDEVCLLIGIKPYILRFWESEFPEIVSVKSDTGAKVFEHKNIEILVYLKKLLLEDKLTIDKAKRELKLYLHSPEFLERVVEEPAPVEVMAEDVVYQVEVVQAEPEQGSLFEEPAAQEAPAKVNVDTAKIDLAKTKLFEVLAMTEKARLKYSWTESAAH